MMKKTATAPPAVRPVSVSLLGRFTLELNGRSLSGDRNRSLKVWSVLAYLILHRDRPVLQSELIEVFWSDDSGSNPVNALKTLLYRIRTMLDPLFPPELSPILAQRGAYLWNPAVECELDIDQFEALCRLAGSTSLPEDEQMSLYREAIGLYQGDLLPKLEHQMWMMPLTAYYRGLYLSAVKSLANLLDRTECFQEMQMVCQRAAEVERLDEELHTLIVRSLLRQGKNNAALAHYESAVDLLYRSLKVRPSKALRALYTEIMSIEKDLETDMGVIMDSLREAAARPGAFACEYGLFEEIYRLEVRRAVRSGACPHLCLITVSLPDGRIPPLEVLSTAMDQLQSVLTQCLRRGDVISKFSGAQFIVLLPSISLENSNAVMNRVVSAFYMQHRRSFFKLTVCIRAIDLAQTAPEAPSDHLSMEAV